MNNQRKIWPTIATNAESLLIGDKMTGYAGRHLSDNGISTVCMPEARIQDIPNIILKAKQYVSGTLKTIGIHVGSNNWADGDSSTTIANNLNEVLTQARKHHPTTKFVVSGILDRLDAEEGEISKFNGAIRKKLKSMDNVEFTDLNIRGFNSNSCLHRNGINPNIRGTQSICKALSKNL
jgi:lysophospholipase L1-like esterase